MNDQDAIYLVRRMLVYLEGRDQTNRGTASLEHDKENAAALRCALRALDREQGSDPFDALEDLVREIEDHRLIPQGAQYNATWAAYAKCRGILAPVGR